MRRSLAGAQSRSGRPLTLKITDFGPISSGTITTKPLTILVGPNGCGKSHVATLAYAIVRAEYIPLTELFGAADREHLDFSFEQAKRISALYTPNSEYILDSDTYKIFAQKITNNFSRMLSSLFLVEPKKLIHLDKTHFELDITSKIIDGKIQFDINDVDMTFKKQQTKHIKFIFKKDMRRLTEIHINGDTFEVNVPYYGALDRQKGVFPMIMIGMEELINYLSTKRGIYFPAERGGLAMAQRSLTLHYYNMRGNVHINSPDRNLTSVATDFLSMLLMSDRTEGKFADLATRFEALAMRGKIVIKNDPNNILDIIFVQNNEEFPLNASASSVKDLAAFLLYLKHIAKRDDVVILEEPETCLDPTNQTLLARLLAQLINRGMNIIVTTHSPFFIDQLSNCVVAGENRNDKPGIIPVEERLKKNNVAAYNFVSDKDGYKIEPINVDDEGISQYEFTKVYDKLYNELLELERD